MQAGPRTEWFRKPDLVKVDSEGSWLMVRESDGSPVRLSLMPAELSGDMRMPQLSTHTLYRDGRLWKPVTRGMTGGWRKLIPADLDHSDASIAMLLGAASPVPTFGHAW